MCVFLLDLYTHKTESAPTITVKVVVFVLAFLILIKSKETL